MRVILWNNLNFEMHSSFSGSNVLKVRFSEKLKNSKGKVMVHCHVF